MTSCRLDQGIQLHQQRKQIHRGSEVLTSSLYDYFKKVRIQYRINLIFSPLVSAFHLKKSENPQRFSVSIPRSSATTPGFGIVVVAVVEGHIACDEIGDPGDQ